MLKVSDIEEQEKGFTLSPDQIVHGASQSLQELQRQTMNEKKKPTNQYKQDKRAAAVDRGSAAHSIVPVRKDYSSARNIKVGYRVYPPLRKKKDDDRTDNTGKNDTVPAHTSGIHQEQRKKTAEESDEPENDSGECKKECWLDSPTSTCTTRSLTSLKTLFDDTPSCLYGQGSISQFRWNQNESIDCANSQAYEVVFFSPPPGGGDANSNFVFLDFDDRVIG